MTNKEAIKEIKDASDNEVKALEKDEKCAPNTERLIQRFREIQRGHRTDGGFHRGVSACLRILLEETEGGEENGCGC